MTLLESDVRSMVRLLGETVAVAGGHQEKKRFLMNGLCRLIDADSWAWTLGCQTTPGAPQVYVGVVHGGFDEARYAALLEALAHPDMGAAVSHFYAAIADSHDQVTMLRDEIDPQGIAYRDGPRQLWQRANIGSLMMIGYPLDESSLSAIAIYRTLDEKPFTLREKQIAHIVLEEVPWLHMVGWPEDKGATVPQLSPRQRTVLNLLLDGLGRKQIANHLGITENTVSGYVKEVYRHFSVNSQAELMRKFLTANLD